MSAVVIAIVVAAAVAATYFLIRKYRKPADAEYKKIYSEVEAKVASYKKEAEQVKQDLKK